MEFIPWVFYYTVDGKSAIPKSLHYFYNMKDFRDRFRSLKLRAKVFPILPQTVLDRLKLQQTHLGATHDPDSNFQGCHRAPWSHSGTSGIWQHGCVTAVQCLMFILPKTGAHFWFSAKPCPQQTSGSHKDCGVCLTTADSLNQCGDSCTDCHKNGHKIGLVKWLMHFMTFTDLQPWWEGFIMVVNWGLPVFKNYKS